MPAILHTVPHIIYRFLIHEIFRIICLCVWPSPSIQTMPPQRLDACPFAYTKAPNHSHSPTMCVFVKLLRHFIATYLQRERKWGKNESTLDFIQGPYVILYIHIAYGYVCCAHNNMHRVKPLVHNHTLQMWSERCVW